MNYFFSTSIHERIQEECNFLRARIESLKTAIQELAASSRLRREKKQEREQRSPPPPYSFVSVVPENISLVPSSSRTLPQAPSSSRTLPQAPSSSRTLPQAPPQSSPQNDESLYFHPTQIPTHAPSYPPPVPISSSSSSSSSSRPIHETKSRNLYDASLRPKTVYFVNENGRTKSLIANNPVFFRNHHSECSLEFDIFELSDVRPLNQQPLKIHENLLVYLVEYADFQGHNDDEKNETRRRWKQQASSDAALVLYAILVPLEIYFNNAETILEAVYASPYNILIIYQGETQKTILTAPVTVCNTILRAYDYILQGNNNTRTIPSQEVSFSRDIGIYAAVSSFLSFDEKRLKTLSFETCRNKIHFHFLKKRVDDKFTKTDIKGEGILATILLPLEEYKGDEVEQVRQQYDAFRLREFLPALARERDTTYMEVYVLFEDSPLPATRYPHVIFYLDQSGFMKRQRGSFCDPLPPTM